MSDRSAGQDSVRSWSGSSPGLLEALDVPIRELSGCFNGNDRSQSSTRRNRRALPITESELIVIAALAHIGLMRTPKIG